MSSLSVFQPIPAAIQRAKRILFEPFQLHKWLRLGFCAFLMGPTLPIAPFGGGDATIDSSSGSGQGTTDTFTPWLQENLATILVVGAIAAAVVFSLAVLLTWLSSRARFMLLDGVVQNRGALGVPWREYRREGNSLFRFRFLLGLISTLALTMIVGMVLLINRGDWREGVFSVRALAVMVVASFLFVAWLLLMQLITMLLMDFVVPVMYVHRLPVLPAGKRVIKTLLREHPGSLVLYLLARFLLNSVLATLSMLLIVLTCFIGAIPYIGSVILLPLTIFQITYPLAFLEQLGPEWRILPPDRQALEAS